MATGGRRFLAVAALTLWVLLATSVSETGTQSSPALPANFSVAYNGTVGSGEAVTYTFTYQEPPNTTEAVRLHVTSPDAIDSHPLLVVVRQEDGILSFQVPLRVEDYYLFNEIERTLCPAEEEAERSADVTKTVYVQLTSSAAANVTYSLTVTKVVDFDFGYNDTKDISVSPAEPQYFSFTFPGHVDTVVVRATAQDDKCSVLSLQRAKCPVYDLDSNIEFSGIFQTFTSSAAITVQKEHFPDGKFYLVVGVKPIEFECTGKAYTIQPITGEIDRQPTMKEVTIHVEETLTEADFVTAVLAALAIFGLFYLVSGLVILGTWFRESRNGKLDREMDSIEDSFPPENKSLTETGKSSYGATGEEEAHSDGRAEETAPADGSPPRKESVDISSYDTLDDIDTEKEVYRTKRVLYVADLARKEDKRLSKKFRLYNRNLITIAVFYALPVTQLVFTYQIMMNRTGDQDLCYYNFLCIHPYGVLSAFNNVWSNIGFVMLGFLLMLLVYRRDRLHKKQVESGGIHAKLALEYGLPKHFGLYYAIALALVMEGIMSACYHVCPNYSNFQFDTSFMYIIGGLGMLKLYQKRHPDVNPNAYAAYMFFAGVIFMAVIGVVYGTKAFWGVFTVVYILATLFLNMELYYMGRWSFDLKVFKRAYVMLRTDYLQCTDCRPMYTSRFVLLTIGNLVNLALALAGAVYQFQDFASFLLGIVISNLLIYFGFYIVMKMISGERISAGSCLLIALSATVWAAALYFFLEANTSWQKMPAQSRAQNRPCVLLGFYDTHDIWHFLSAVSLFCSFIVLLVLDDDLDYVRRDQIVVF
ncbi:PREDICTED: SID1 transmembrane family member 1-like isoform X1 [Branchiostoma belcheri]|uniref:SID1 transmembrane family member 1-like isoform X1 n=2 Tax=Branchiostoma belcheri TaxID=7741 RepID=A0A6P4Y7Y8_BRABE|nr:PREDICTED: SID1 transmembrane family member 1-like isoform X1 [Branchiostoma belcheri]